MILLECPLARLSPSSVSCTRSCLSIFSIRFTNLCIVIFHFLQSFFIGKIHYFWHHLCNGPLDFFLVY
ncbi:hypothetical protein E2C01_065362 [Portunus trituberculatus]|uniref:Uncharacterized protein n=1 Tax=Portunus trituberculatus TaxID=210409 RepID=A0A5B7HLP4_PORTR|nr:hypothetical protein [Portunus trituberculatus]